MRHLTDEEILELIDRVPGRSREKEGEDHLRTCSHCRRRQAGLIAVDQALEQSTTERASSGLAAAVLRRLGIADKDPLIYRLLEKSAHLFALAIVLTILVSIFVMSGVIDVETGGGESMVQRLIGIDLFASLEYAGGWVQTYLPVGGQTGIGVAIALVAFLLGLIDRVVGRRVLSS